MDFAIGLNFANFVFNSPNGQVKFFEGIQITYATYVNIITEIKGDVKNQPRGHSKILSPRWDLNPRPSVF